jgi:Fe2+ transport system protein B
MFDLIEKFFSNRCPSENLTPLIDNCNDHERKFKRQVLTFHPDKNPNCYEDATIKFQNLTNHFNDCKNRNSQQRTTSQRTTSQRTTSQTTTPTKDQYNLTKLLLVIFFSVLLIFFILWIIFIKKKKLINYKNIKY